MLRKTLAGYLLLQVDTFITGLGKEAIGPAMNMLTDKSAQLKIQTITEKTRGNTEEAADLLSENLADSMGETFSSDYNITRNGSQRTVTLNRCGCIESVLENAHNYGLTGPEVRSIFCGSCIGSYKKAATSLELDFKGKLSKAGCYMSFSTKQ